MLLILFSSKQFQETSVYLSLSLYLLKAQWDHCMTISISTAVDFPVNLLHCLFCLTLCAFLFLSVHSLFPPAAAGLLIVLRLSIDKDIDRYK